MKRRVFMAGMAGAAALAPFAGRAQDRTVPVVGFLHAGTLAASTEQLAAFRKGLSEIGFVEGRNIAIEFRWAEAQYDRLPGLAAELLQGPVTVLVTGGGPAAALAAKAATSVIPVVFISGDDPVRYGLVESLARPGGNVTGVVFFQVALAAKRLDVLRELLPTLKTVGYMVNPRNPEAEHEVRYVQTSAHKLDLALHVRRASNEREIDDAFASLRELGVTALQIGSDPYYFSRRNQIAELSARHAIPVMATTREYAAAGSVITYGTSIPDAFHQMGIYAGQILKGAKPADLPVVQSTKFELVINLKAAKTLGIAVPQSLQVAADEVIE